jgi:hypothetical protein
MATMRRDNLEPTNASKAALANGMAATSHNSWNILTPQLIGSVYIQRGLPLVEQEYECQSDGDFGRRHCENEQEHHLTVRLPPPGASCDEGQAARIEHDLNAHEREDEVTPREKSG